MDSMVTAKDVRGIKPNKTTYVTCWRKENPQRHKPNSPVHRGGVDGKVNTSSDKIKKYAEDNKKEKRGGNFH